jgi:small subunit ribosomal protein S7
MPRRREVPKRDILPDPKFGNVEVSKFVNTIMKCGKKSVAERIVYGAFDQIVTKTGKDPLEVFGLALGNIKPLVEVKSRRVGGANYQVPVEVRPSRRMALAMRWLRESARKRSEKSMGQRLAAEMLEAQKAVAVRSRNAMKCTVWQKPTRRLRTSGSRYTSSGLALAIALY